MFDKMKQLYEMQKKAKEIQRQLEVVKLTKTSGDEKISLVLNGLHRVENIRIDPVWLSPEKKASLEAVLKQLINEGLEEIQRQTAAQAADLMKDFKIPGL
jgi:DNA-binding YbaB/EbfC family protein